MEPFLVGILVPLGAFAMIFGIVYVIVTSRNRERMAMIERGADASLFESKKKAGTGGILKVGLLLLGIGFGILMAYFITSLGIMDEDSAYGSMIFIFGGLALIGSYLWQRKQEKQEESKV
jgi:preprotein translocase subunit YajC